VRSKEGEEKLKTSLLKIRNLYGLTEVQLNGGDYLVTGKNGAGKSSILDAVRLALTNKSDRTVIVRQGETEGEIILETDTGLSIDRKIRTNQAPYSSF